MFGTISHLYKTASTITIAITVELRHRTVVAFTFGNADKYFADSCASVKTMYSVEDQRTFEYITLSITEATAEPGLSSVNCVHAGVLVLLALAFLTPLFFYIPDAALAAVIIMAVIDIIDFSMIPHLWRIRS
jgi:Sulfate permease family